MKIFLSFFIVFVLSLLQATVLRINFLLLFVLWKRSYFWAFLAGLIFDLMVGNRLGLSSLLFLLILLLFRLYSRKYEPHGFFLAVFAFLSSYIFAKVEAGAWSFWQGLILALCLLLLRKKFQKAWQLKLGL